MKGIYLVLIILIIIVVAISIYTLIETVLYVRKYPSRDSWENRFTDQHQEMLRMLTHLHDLFKRHNIVYWAHGGTLIGLVRHGAIMKWDDDIDVAIYSPSPEDEAEKRKEFDQNWNAFLKEVGRRSEAADFRIYMLDGDGPYKSNVIKFFSLNQKGVFIDIMPYQLKKDTFMNTDKKVFRWQSWWCSRLTNEWFYEDEVFPLVCSKINKTTDVMVPRIITPFLNRSYKTWATQIRVQIPHSDCRIPYVTPWAVLSSKLFATKYKDNYLLTADEKERASLALEKDQHLIETLNSNSISVSVLKQGSKSNPNFVPNLTKI